MPDLGLEPIDVSQCQSEVKKGSFMSFGIPSHERCVNAPVYIAVDVRDNVFYGAMSLCEKCKQICGIQLPSASYQKIKF